VIKVAIAEGPHPLRHRMRGLSLVGEALRIFKNVKIRCSPSTHRTFFKLKEKDPSEEERVVYIYMISYIYIYLDHYGKERRKNKRIKNE
jgi:hypothetical protein